MEKKLEELNKKFEDEKLKDKNRERKNFIKDFGVTNVSRSQLDKMIKDSKVRGVCR